ncbi:AMP-binding protein [Streptomyces sp. NPDC087866]|uniref:AMP-binding protein n=1 Tax=unclassified Streptomyces TaxID=2593676 RepID=UPI00225A328C|nr:AMP-binding protein [Streptomyces sp. NBC_01789]MCX4451245.1 AMP-binding protein [Streptomyces sp. NBC_01789]
MSAQYGPVKGEFVSYVEAILDVLSAEPQRTVITTADGSRIRAADLRDRVHRLAAELGDRGVGRGTTVALLTGSTAEALVARYAANLAAGKVVTLYEGTSATTMADIMASVDCSLLLVDGSRQERGAELAAASAYCTLSLGPSSYAEDVLALADLRPAHPVRVRIHPEDDWRIGHTGGTTGIPKGIRMSHASHRRGLDDRLAGAGEPPRFLACTSLAHLAGLLIDRTLYQHGSVVLQDGFDPGEVLAAVARERITHTWLLPPLLYQLLDHPDLAGTDLRSLSRITYGGTAASPDRLREAAAALGPVLYGWYGQAEAQLITEAGPGEQELTGRDGHLTVGRPMPGVEIAVRSPDGTLLPPGEPGEVQVRSHHVMHGYWKQPELTAEVLKDGWLHTGDVGYLDEDGHLFIVDRIKEMIVVVGGHVYPADLEELLLRHPDVARCTVFGSRDEHALEQVHAAVVPVAGRGPSLEELRDFVTARKGALYAPHAVHLVPDIPLTAVGKPDRRLLRSRLTYPSAAAAPEAEGLPT